MTGGRGEQSVGQEGVCAESWRARGPAHGENKTSSGARAYGRVTQADLLPHAETRL